MDWGPRQDFGSARQQCSRHADQRFRLRIKAAHEAVADHPQLVERGAGAVHFPVAGNKRANSWRHGVSFSDGIPDAHSHYQNQTTKQSTLTEKDAIALPLAETGRDHAQ
jgi:hypothetical protein